eukprot:5794917-Pleurochrysis_carterae.AAC.1
MTLTLRITLLLLGTLGALQCCSDSNFSSRSGTELHIKAHNLEVTAGPQRSSHVGCSSYDQIVNDDRFCFWQVACTRADLYAVNRKMHPVTKFNMSCNWHIDKRA